MSSQKAESEKCVFDLCRLIHCDFTHKGCADLASALTSDPSHLIELDLYGNKIGDLGVKLLSAGLENPHCKLERLWYSEIISL